MTKDGIDSHQHEVGILSYHEACYRLRKLIVLLDKCKCELCQRDKVKSEGALAKLEEANKETEEKDLLNIAKLLHRSKNG